MIESEDISRWIESTKHPTIIVVAVRTKNMCGCFFVYNSVSEKLIGGGPNLLPHGKKFIAIGGILKALCLPLISVEASISLSWHPSTLGWIVIPLVSFFISPYFLGARIRPVPQAF